MNKQKKHKVSWVDKYLPLEESKSGKQKTGQKRKPKSKLKTKIKRQKLH